MGAFIEAADESDVELKSSSLVIHSFDYHINTPSIKELNGFIDIIKISVVNYEYHDY